MNESDLESLQKSFSETPIVPILVAIVLSIIIIR